MKPYRLLSQLAIALMVPTSFAHAEVIRFDFYGTVSLAVCGSSLCDPSQMLDSSVRTGTTVSGHYSFDTAAQGTPFPGSGGGALSESILYNGLNGSFETVIGNYTFSSLAASPIYITVADDFYAPSSTVSSDQYRILTRTGVQSLNQPLPELVGINTMNLDFIELGALGQPVPPLSSALLPTDPDLINRFGGGSLVIGLNFAEPIGDDTRLILSISVPGVQLVAPIPEPSTLPLFLVGGAGLLALRRWKSAA